MRVEDVTEDTLHGLMRTLRIWSGLTQKQIENRTSWLPSPPFRKLHAYQVSDYERGETYPSFVALASFLAACSADGHWLDYRLLQRALEAAPTGVEPVELLEGPAVTWT